MSRTGACPAPHEDALQAAARTHRRCTAPPCASPRPTRPAAACSSPSREGTAPGSPPRMRMLRDHLVTDSPSPRISSSPPGSRAARRSARASASAAARGARRALRGGALYAADRAHHIATVVRPHLARGGVSCSGTVIRLLRRLPGRRAHSPPEEIAGLSPGRSTGCYPIARSCSMCPPALDERRADLPARTARERGPGVPRGGARGAPRASPARS